MNHNILLIEDDELDVISVDRTLRKLNIEYTLYTAFNGREALAMLNHPEHPVMPDVILLDLNLPRMNGVEFLKILRADERYRGIKVFVMTTSSEAHDRALTKQLGISDYIIKPLNYTNNAKRANSMDSFMQFHLRKILSEV